MNGISSQPGQTGAISHPVQTKPISSHRHNVNSAILFGGGNFRDCRNPIIYRVYR